MVSENNISSKNSLETEIFSSDLKLASQNKLIRSLQSVIFKPHMRKGAKYHLDIPDETKELVKSGDASILYMGFHRSLWETGGFNWIMHKEGKKSPYIVMGSNLKYTFLSDLFVDKSGIIVYDRDKNVNKKELLCKTKLRLQKHFEKGDDVIMFGGGTRSYDGLPKRFGRVGFEAAINASKNADMRLVLFDVDYMALRSYEVGRFVKHIMGEKQKSAQRPKLKELINFLKGMEDIYIQVGTPLKINETDNQKTLRDDAYNSCLALTKILPVNVWATANLFAYQRNNNNRRAIIDSVEEIMDELKVHQNLLKGFGDLNSKDLVFRIESSVKDPYINGTKEHKAWSKLYYNYVKHHLDELNINPYR